MLREIFSTSLFAVSQSVTFVISSLTKFFNSSHCDEQFEEHVVRSGICFKTRLRVRNKCVWNRPTHIVLHACVCVLALRDDAYLFKHGFIERFNQLKNMTV